MIVPSSDPTCMNAARPESRRQRSTVTAVSSAREMAAAMAHPQVPLHAGLGVVGFSQRAIQPNEVEGAADPGDAGDEVCPPQQQICPIAEPTGHGGSNFTVKPCPASPRQARRTASLLTIGAVS